MACADNRFDKLVLKMLYHFAESPKPPNVNQHKSWIPLNFLAMHNAFQKEIRKVNRQFLSIYFWIIIHVCFSFISLNLFP
jgi:hypothetical protein